MSIVLGNKITTLMVSAANGDTYGDPERHIFRGIQALVMPNIKSMALSTPPVSPANGDTYVVAAAPTGAWLGQVNNVAYWAIDPQDGVVTTGAWEFYAPSAGWAVFDQNSLLTWKYNGTAWLWQRQSGTATITASTTVAVPFTATYAGTPPPTVTVTPVGGDPTAVAAYWVTNTGIGGAWTGFVINVHTSGTQTFNYTVEG